ncbi:hypothetical protein B9Z44_02370 [Limnohabitans curvus]|uniref:DUF1232 domain-containing protein n=1 Tax=Limnohabitans curvus TaxID=323423 RepID=A0A315EP63_9BURK|nr:hypothetical protein B9Z44_02370 [Limnohabitans curvus]
MRFLQAIRVWAKKIKRDSVTLWFAEKHPRTPKLIKFLGMFVVAYALSPIDLIPDFIPVLGYLDPCRGVQQRPNQCRECAHSFRCSRRSCKPPRRRSISYRWRCGGGELRSVEQGRDLPPLAVPINRK